MPRNILTSFPGFISTGQDNACVAQVERHGNALFHCFCSCPVLVAQFCPGSYNSNVLLPVSSLLKLFDLHGNSGGPQRSCRLIALQLTCSGAGNSAPVPRTQLRTKASWSPEEMQPGARRATRVAPRDTDPTHAFDGSAMCVVNHQSVASTMTLP